MSYIHTHTYTHTYIHTHTHKRINTHTHTYTYTYTHIHTHTHTVTWQGTAATDIMMRHGQELLRWHGRGVAFQDLHPTVMV